MIEPSDVGRPVSQLAGNGHSETQHSLHKRKRPSINWSRFWLIFTLAAFLIGVIGGYWLGISDPFSQSDRSGSASLSGSGPDGKVHAMVEQINPSNGYTIPVQFGDVGPKLLAAGGIDLAQFTEIYKQAGKPLTQDQLTILTKGGGPVIINRQNAYFLLNFFWALGLTNLNTILTDGPIMANGRDQVGNLASTGGWTIGAKPPMELYASTSIIQLSKEQQDRLLEVASAVYRPCCNNPTNMPDCNHGMAMLGLLELMASQDASSDEMFATAKYVNAFWYPQQTLEVATLLKATENVDFAQADPRQVVSRQFSSGSGFQAVHQYLIENGLQEQAPNSGGSCGVQ